MKQNASNKLVSIIIPVYNVETCVKKSLISVFQQDYSNIQVVIVDDCGTDNSMTIVCDLVVEYGKQDCVNIIKHERNRGLSAARNTGLQVANGAYVFFMDSDDTISPKCVSQLMDLAIKYNADCVQGNTLVVGGKSSLFPIPRKQLFSSDELIQSFFSGMIHPSAWNKLIKRSFLYEHNILFKEGLIYEDLLYVLELCQNANCVVAEKEYTYNYIIRTNSLTTCVNDDRVVRQYESILHNITSIYKYSESLKDRNTKRLIYKWLAKYSFKSAARLTTIPTSSSLAKKYYLDILDLNRIYKNKCLCITLLRIPWSIFKVIFSLLYTIYKKII